MVKPDPQSSLPTSHPLPRNVVVAGETGVGKSSFINLVIGANNADTSNDVCGVTIRATCHVWETESHTHAFRLWDTPGLGEGSFGSVSPKAALHALRSLLRELNKEGGVHLLILCMRGLARVTKGMRNTYNDILKIRDQVSPQTPVAAVITELEKQCDKTDIIGSMEQWWVGNDEAFSGYNMSFCGHACLTTLADDCFPSLTGRRAKCQQLARNLLIDRSLPFVAFSGSMRMTNALSSPTTKLVRNIVIVGETGVGKSSIINLVVGSDSAVATSDARAVTLGTSYHDWDLLQTQTFRLWDTPGLSDGPIGSPPPRRAHSAVRSLLTELRRRAGVHLIIVCFRGGQRITNKMKQTYDTILALRDQISRDIPLVAVITGLERHHVHDVGLPEITRDSFADSLAQSDELHTAIAANRNSGIVGSAPTSPELSPILGLPESTPSTLSKWESKVIDVLGVMEKWWHTNEGALSNHRMAFTAHACITTLLDDAEPPILGRRDECQRLVRDLIIDHALAPRTVPAQDIHVILFGETGVGKSSLVNLLAGWKVAAVSPDSVACTFTSTEYQFQLGAVTIRLWDTVGLEEPGRGTDGYMGAVEKATELIRRLNDLGGISLFLFCVRGSRVTTTMQSNYRLFYEVLGKKQVPIALAVTNLERETDMEGWWQRNTEMLETHGIHVSGHACITTLEGDPKYVESRNVVQELLWQYADQGKFSMPSERWLARLLNGLNILRGILSTRNKALVPVLTRRCYLEPHVAQRVAACIDTAMDTQHGTISL